MLPLPSLTKDLQDGILDGTTLFRFAHIFRKQSAGGMEAYLQDLNRLLLERNRMQILQMFLAPTTGPLKVEIERVARGLIVWIPSILHYKTNLQSSFFQTLLSKLTSTPAGKVQIYHDFLLSTLSNYPIRFAAFHWISEDSKVVLKYLMKRQIPFIAINHFQNSRLNQHLVRTQISNALAIGGVSNRDVPEFLRNRFTNLSDGVDTDFFDPEKAVALDRDFNGPLLLLPSRITQEKGHLDAVKALGRLIREGVQAVLGFAGRSGSPAFLQNLRGLIAEEGLKENVIFAGELSRHDLRNWYGASTVVLLPSSSEGLGRVLLEAQAMKRVAVAYNVGGVAEALPDRLSGFLVKKGDIRGLASRLKHLLEDHEQRSEMGEQGRSFVLERFSMRSLARRHEQFYSSIISQLD